MILSLLAAVTALPFQVGPTTTGWQLVWSDEFEGKRLDPDKWTPVRDCWGGGNEERQCYTDLPANVHLADGLLHIVARRERSTGFALPEDQRAKAPGSTSLAVKPFTSARLTTKGKAAWRYGRIAVRAKLPQGQGTWPAIWMLPEESHYGPWAASGEIDIMEAVNLGVGCRSCPRGSEDRILGTLHFGGPWPSNRHSSRELSYPPVLEGFHVYAVDWSEGRISWSVDGRVYAVQTSEDWNSGSPARAAPFDKPFHLILNLAIGGRLAESRNRKGIDPRNFPKSMQVDWVRVWQCAKDPETGRGCVGN